MPNNFTDTLNKIAKKVNDENQKNNTNEFDFVFLDKAVSCWCEELGEKFGFDQQNIISIRSYIYQRYQRPEMGNLISYLWEESKTQKKQSEIFGVCRNTIVDNPLYQKINSLLSRINPNFRTTSTEFIVLIAFVITAVGYCVYLINHSPKQQEQLRQKTNNTLLQTSSQISPSTSTTPSPQKQPLVKYLLVLVVAASNKSLIDSLKIQEKINKENSEQLYNATQYLCQDTQSNLSSKLTNLNNQFKVIEPSEYDIYLITIELNQADERFKPNVNQLDRYDAFRNLDLTNAKIQ